MKNAIAQLKCLLSAAGRWVALCALLCVAPAVLADVVVTAGGESLSGTITRVAEGILVFRTSLKGQMMLPMSEVRSLASAQRWIVTHHDEGVEIGRLVHGGIVVEGQGEGRAEQVLPLDYATIRSIKNAPPLAATPAPPSETSTRWQQRVSTSLSGYAGSEDGARASLAWAGMRDGLKTRLGLRLRVDGQDEDSVGDYLAGALNMLPQNPAGWSPYLDLRVERQVDEALQWRTGASVGVRYDFDDDPEQGYFAYVGAGLQRSQWRGRERHPLAARESESHTALGPEAGVGYGQPAWGGGQWDSRLSIQPGSSSGSAFRAQAESTLSYPLSPKLSLRFDVSVAFEEDPVFDTLERFNTRFGAGLEFKF